MDSMDVCSLFYNLVLNSIEANYKLSNNRFIKLYVANIKRNLLIKIINPVDKYFDINIIKENKTTKEDKENHGLGTQIINDIAYKYNGNVKYEIVDNQFIANVMLECVKTTV